MGLLSYFDFEPGERRPAPGLNERTSHLNQGDLIRGTGATRLRSALTCPLGTPYGFSPEDSRNFPQGER